MRTEDRRDRLIDHTRELIRDLQTCNRMDKARIDDLLKRVKVLELALLE